MLSYDEELGLSDSIVARRAIRDLLAEEDRDPTEEEMEVIRLGDEAARTLVNSYIPLIQRLASTVFKRNYSNKSAVGWDHGDLVNEGVEAALKTARSFNARGTGEHPGLRFARYASQSITKAMNRMVAKYSTPYKADVSAMQATWTWRAAADEFQQRYGRLATDDELSDLTGINPGYVLPGLPGRASFADVDGPEYASIPSAMVDSISDENSYQESVRILEMALIKMLPDYRVKFARVLFALDSNVPYEAEDMAKMIGVSTRRAENMKTYLLNFVSHPRYRVWAYRYIQEYEEVRRVSNEAAQESRTIGVSIS